MKDFIQRTSIKWCQWRLRPYPAGLQLEVTNRCNMRCIMCPMHRPGTDSRRPVGEMSIQDYDRIVTEFKNMGGRVLIPQGAGEPFLHPSIIPMLELAKIKHHLQVCINTNGSCLDIPTLHILARLGIDELGFSIDAASASVFKKITSVDRLARIEEILKAMLAIRSERRAKKPLIRILLVDQEANHEEIPEYISKWIHIVDEVVIQSERVDSGRHLKIPRKEVRRPCRHLFETLFVQWDGDLVVCCEDWNSQSVIGNVRSDSLKGMWYGERMNAYRAMQKEGSYLEPDICRSCQAWSGGKKHCISESDRTIIRTALTSVYRRNHHHDR